MDDYEELSEHAKQAWQRGFDLAHPRRETPTRWRDVHETANRDDAQAGVDRAMDLVAGALQNLSIDERPPRPFARSGARVRLVVMDPLSIEAVIVEFDKTKTDECKDALGKGFLRGIIAKAKADRAEDPNGGPPTMN